MDTRAVRSAPPSLMRSGAFSLVTSVAPLVVALVSLPLLTRYLGTERLGLLALAWAWLGYATLLDFGLGRALTRMVASSDAGEAFEAPVGAFIATANLTLTGVGAVVGLLGAALAPWYVTNVLDDLSPSIRTDATISSILFALTVPLVTGASAARAVLEARHQFRAVNLVRLPVSVGTFAVPTLLLPFTASLTVIALTLGAVRLWAWWRYRTLARVSMPRREGDAPRMALLRPLLRAGAWMTVSNVLSPLMSVADRFLIGSLISVSAVALYAVPWEAVTKLWIVPGALTMVLFPAVARALTADRSHLSVLHAATARALALLVLPACVTSCLLAPWLLSIAGGAAYLGDSVQVLRVLTIGVAANCIAAVPFTVLQASGRARWTAVLHLTEVVPYAILLWMGAQRFGLIGVAGAWTIRVVIDAALLAWRAQAVAPLPLGAIALNIGTVITVACSAWFGATQGTADNRGSIVAIPLAIGIAALLWFRRPAVERHVLSRNGGPR